MSNGIEKSVFKYQLKSLEKIPARIWDDPNTASIHIAQTIANAIKEKQSKGDHIVLGLATGSSPMKVYEELVRLHKEEQLSFRNVYTFNLDEYYPIHSTAPQSYVRFMDENLFNHIDIPKENIHIPDGTLAIEDIREFCSQFESKIDALGGIDIQLLGIGRTGHIGFNEPGAWENSITRLVRLDNITRIDASKDFPSDEEVPYRAITMGIGTILKARSIIVMAWGQHKANMVRKTLEGQITPQIPASFLQRHPQTEFHIDNAAASKLTRNTAPWLVNVCNWDDDLVCKAVVWLSKKLKKPILKLTNEDYAENGLSDLMLDVASSYSINIRIFNRLQRTITGWPGGKPNEDDLYRPERAVPAQKRAIIFSPHPDDDVISMGGTFLRLVDQGHDVHVAYQTSGNIAVHDHDAKRFVEFMKDFNDQLSFNYPPFENVHDLMIKALAEKSSPGKIDVPEVRLVKGLIRRGEARAGARFCGLSDEKIHFLDLPFYETGTRRKNNLSQADVDKIKTLLQEIKPHQIFAAGDLADPHDTHKVCLDAILAALKELKNEPWIKDCWLWLYRGAWHEFEIHEIHMTIPLSPEELIKKRRAIFMHQSQKDRPPFPGDDEREFWQRAEERNKATAQTYRNLGLSEYEAMEAFARYDY